jgi:hypothetical protein
MQTERVTFLTTPDHKAALDAFARESGMSVGHLVREATSQFITHPPAANDAAELALEQLIPEIEAMLPEWNARLDRMEANLDRAHLAVREALAKVEELGF